MNRHERLLRDLADATLKYGVMAERSSGRIRPVLPGSANSLEVREAIATTLVSGFTGQENSLIREIIRAIRRGNTMYEVRERVLADVRGTVFEAERGAAMVALLNRGLDADPMFTRIAAAKDADEVRRMMASRSLSVAHTL